MGGALIQVYAVDKGMKLAGVKTKRPLKHYVHCIKLNFFERTKMQIPTPVLTNSSLFFQVIQTTGYLGG